jgi:hypothetical protein
MDGWMDGWVVVNDFLHLLRKVVGKCIQMPLPLHHSRWMDGWMDDIKSIYHTLCVTNYVQKSFLQI